jgi:aminoglycoside phosphotransferase (APT) family kinase protein
VFAFDEGTVLRRYRSDYDCLYEAAMMQHVAAHGYPVPAVYAVAGRDLVMERLDGVTLLTLMPKRPWTITSSARTIAGFLQRLHDIPVPEWAIRKHATGDALVHLDLHPDNVMLTSRGPVVIDWSNAGVGDPDVEVADLWLIFACASVPGSLLERMMVGAGRKLFLNGVLKRFDRAALRKALPLALENRSHDRNMSEEELERMRELVGAEAR